MSIRLSYWLYTTILTFIYFVHACQSHELYDTRSPNGGVTLNGYLQKPGIFYFLNEELRWRDRDFPFYNMLMSIIATTFINLIDHIEKSEEGLMLYYSKEVARLAKKGEVINSIYKSFLTVKGSKDELKIYEEQFKPLCKNYRIEIAKSPIISIVSHSASRLNAYNYLIPFIPNEVLDPVMKKFSIEVTKFLWPQSFAEMSNGFITMIEKLEKLCKKINFNLLESCNEYMQQARRYLIDLINNHELFLKYSKMKNANYLDFSNIFRKLRGEILSFKPYQIVLRKLDPVKADALGIPMFSGFNHSVLDETMKEYYELLKDRKTKGKL
ncbi:uncharacterized protein cubi_01021 [Cryptosporidium ubiquitum]|uniref:Uncharacterized protein n=1 Tax=Cryptosporidium ubiquitum TaxID=857276 RepID=A0A1J4MCZ2_9CRYT|nr:uncharacterized protein cubi_01021 [Cryptosporidium ubiquitum]OII70876.1 hypothetical protein cubi_01021 [Cryptosporidium ubiquitum]